MPRTAAIVLEADAHALVDVGLDVGRRHVDHAHALHADRLAQRFAGGADGVLGRGVAHRDRTGLAVADRADVDDGARLAGLHVADHGLGAVQDSLEVDVDLAAEGLGFDIGEGARIGHAGVVDQAGGLAELLLGSADGARQRGIVGDVGLGVGRAVGRQPVHRLHVACDQQQRIAFLGEGASQGESDAGTRSGDDDERSGQGSGPSSLRCRWPLSSARCPRACPSRRRPRSVRARGRRDRPGSRSAAATRRAPTSPSCPCRNRCRDW